MLLLYLVLFKLFLLFTNVWKSILCLYMFTCFKIWALHTSVCQSSSASWLMKEGKLLFNWPTPCSIILEKLIFPQSEIPHILCNLKVHFCVHKSPPLDPILSRRIQFVPHHISKIHFIVILPSVPRSSKCYIVLVSSFLYCILPVDMEVSVLNRIGFCSYSLSVDSKAD